MKYEIENAFVFDKDGNPVSDIDIDIENALMKGIRGLKDRIDEVQYPGEPMRRFFTLKEACKYVESAAMQAEERKYTA